MPGTLKVRCKSGLRIRIIGTPIETSKNADSVPILTMSESIEISNTEETNATTTPAIICMVAGVPFLPTLESPLGSKPSRLTANIIRVRPSNSTITTVVKPITIPKDMIFAAQTAPTNLKLEDNEGESIEASSL